ncbi:dermatan-sulfate epimerase-like protein [Sycon ciliatum]|uniref:dermatan-sulfate epimerase-like protein n=1 Tax=Sycon ciliatum TaxID=27933 RepID=UPI0020ABA6CB|eukprot:scpid10717/ scgid31150/ Dermatan-sulfate epimerase-like protein
MMAGEIQCMAGSATKRATWRVTPALATSILLWILVFVGLATCVQPRMQSRNTRRKQSEHQLQQQQRQPFRNIAAGRNVGDRTRILRDRGHSQRQGDETSQLRHVQRERAWDDRRGNLAMRPGARAAVRRDGSRHTIQDFQPANRDTTYGQGQRVEMHKPGNRVRAVPPMQYRHVTQAAHAHGVDLRSQSLKQSRAADDSSRLRQPGQPIDSRRATLSVHQLTTNANSAQRQGMAASRANAMNDDDATRAKREDMMEKEEQQPDDKDGDETHEGDTDGGNTVANVAHANEDSSETPPNVAGNTDRDNGDTANDEHDVNTSPTLSPEEQEKVDRERVAEDEKVPDPAVAADVDMDTVQSEPIEEDTGVEGTVSARVDAENKDNVAPAQKPVNRNRFGELQAQLADLHKSVQTPTANPLPSYEQLLHGSRIREGHPMLLFGDAELKSLIKQTHNTHSGIYNDMKAAVKVMLQDEKKYLPPVAELDFATSWNEQYGNRLVVLAIYGALSPDDLAGRAVAVRSLRRLTAYSSWKVLSAPNDDVPRAHTLLGVAIAYDVLFHELKDYERHDMAMRISEETAYLQRRALANAGWNRQYMHNHMLTLQVALLAGALVTEQTSRAPSHEQQALARLAMERCMLLLRHVSDGSIHEGVGYTSYSTRSLFVYIFLSQRHYGVSHFEHKWLPKHFEYLLATTMPGFAGSVGIADTDRVWFFGPEAQLYFLDRYVLRNGQANWLAQKIHQARHKLPADATLKEADWSMLPFEMLWFAPHMGVNSPWKATNRQPVQILDDWGVATYGASHQQQSTFLSLKSSYILGRGLHRLAATSQAPQSLYPFLGGMPSFNAGHEHPDQGSFTFYPNGVPMVTESFYFMPKLPHMDNVWLFRSDGSASEDSCSDGGMRGQLGGCKSWFQYRSDAVRDMSADILVSDSDEDVVLMVSESAGAYSEDMGLESVTRALVLLRSDALLVVDCIRKKPTSIVLRGSAFFNNMYQPFSVDFEDATRATSTAGHTIQWLFDNDLKSSARTGTVADKRLQKKRDGREESYYLKVSAPLLLDTTHVVWLLTADSAAVAEMELISSSSSGVSVSVSIGSSSYAVSMVTNHTCVACRYDYHGSGMLAHVRHGDRLVRPGTTPVDMLSKVDLDLRPMKNILPSTVNQQVFGYLCISIIGWSVTVLFVFWRFKFLRQPRYMWPVVLCVVLWIGILLILIASSILHELPNSMKLAISLSSIGIGGEQAGDVLLDAGGSRPRVLITGLPMGKAPYLLSSHLLNATPDAVFLPLSDLPMKAGVALSPLASCIWPSTSVSPLQALAASWLTQVYDQAQPALKHATTRHKPTEAYLQAKAKLAVDPSALIIAGDMDGTWLAKTRWFLDSVPSSKVVLLICHPVRWVADIMKVGSLLPNSGVGLYDQVARILKPVGNHCDDSSPCARLFEPLRKLALSEVQREDAPLHKVLATVWLAYTKWSLCEARQHGSVLTVKLEDFLSHAVGTSRKFYRFVGLPHRPVVISHLRILMESDVPQDGQAKADLDRSSGKFYTLSPEMRLDVRKICYDLMRQLGY